MTAVALLQAAKCHDKGSGAHRQGYGQLHAVVILECHHPSVEAGCGQNLRLAQLCT